MLGPSFFVKKLLCSIMPILEIEDTKFRTQYWQKKCKKYLKRYIENRKEFELKKKKTLDSSKVIWVLWLQGEDHMPLIVKKCFESLKRYRGEFNVILLSQDTVSEFIELPSFINRKYLAGAIPIALYSDIIRLELLTAYGGLWVDATVYFTGNIQEYITDSDVFFFQNSLLDYSVIKCSTWLIYSKNPSNYIISTIRNVLYSYYEKERYPVNQFIFHLIVSGLIEYDKDFKARWDDMIYICNMNPHAMWFSFQKKYSKQIWENLINTSPVHKLSWKIIDDDYKDDTLYRYLLRKDNLE